ncbi:hypothetical protein BHM03_00051187 [Ensete ventricosum]|nr:hypothetical protein BHM03_00051187 [Ensete ventricosum]
MRSAKTIAGAIRKKRLEEGCDQDLSVVSGNICRAGDRGCQGCGALVGLETGEVVGVGAVVGDFTGECVGASCSVLALDDAGRSVLISLVPSVEEADVPCQ